MKKYQIKTIVVTTIFILSLLSSCQVGRFVWYNYANITDYKIFPSRTVHKSTVPFTFYQSATGNTPKKIIAKNSLDHNPKPIILLLMYIIIFHNIYDVNNFHNNSFSSLKIFISLKIYVSNYSHLLDKQNINTN